MTDLHTRLAENQRIIEASTPGPWVWSEERDVWDDCGPSLETAKRTDPHPFDGSTGAEETVVSAWGHDAWGIFVEERDATFIAASRTEWARENAALRKVLELLEEHEKYDDAIGTSALRKVLEEEMSDDNQ